MRKEEGKSEEEAIEIYERSRKQEIIDDDRRVLESQRGRVVVGKRARETE